MIWEQTIAAIIERGRGLHHWSTDLAVGKVRWLGPLCR